LIFADGGITVLGANIFNMALVGSIPAMIYFYLNQKSKFFNGKFAKISAIFFTSWFSIVLASVICSIELALSQVIGFTKVLPAMTFVHSIIGLFEGAITLSLILLLETPKIKNSTKLSFTVPFISSAAIALLLTPFASGFPDGLEYVANKYAFIREGSTLLLSPLPDYTLPFITNEFLSTGIAGLAGVLIVFAIVFLSGMLLKKRNDAPKNAI
ncbi:MAG TPA: energy-coupling factor ABC transporter permease, partial [Spirochaetota bacterium]|nr:energy-coupling factor ABC transporter permease [Spirochaetota bacterium]